MDATKALVIIFSLFAAGMIIRDLADVGKHRADAAKECFKAAQTNPRIACTQEE